MFSTQASTTLPPARARRSERRPSSRRALSWRPLPAILAAVLTGLGASHAYRVSPLVLHLTPTGKGAVSYVTIDNTHDYQLTIEATINLRQFTDGAEGAETPADGDFLLFPPQAIIAPGASQRMQVRYVAGPLDEARAYRLAIKQIPIDLEGGEGAQLAMAYNFFGAVYVAAEGAAPAVAISSVRPDADGYTATLTNDGTAHARLGSMVWTGRSAGGERATLVLDQIPLQDVPVLEPGGTRAVTIPASALGTLGDLAGLEVTQEG